MTWYIYRLEMSQQLSAPFMLAIFYLIVSPFQSQECGDFRVLPICTITVTALYGECDAFP